MRANRGVELNGNLILLGSTCTLRVAYALILTLDMKSKLLLECILFAL